MNFQVSLCVYAFLEFVQFLRDSTRVKHCLYCDDSFNFSFSSILAASVLKAVLRYGKKQFVVDETRRDTYRNPVALGYEPPVLSAFEDNFKQLLAVRNSIFCSSFPVSIN